MLRASMKGHLRVVKWLCEVGATDDIRTKDNDGRTPMMSACMNGHLSTAQWAYAMGATEDIFTKNNYGETPLKAALARKHHATVLWLVLQGTVNEVSILAHNMLEATKKTLSGNIAALLDQRAIFIRFVLPATRFPTPTLSDEVLSSKKLRASSSAPSPLALLGGHSGHMVRLIADFAGVVSGKQLGNSRKALAALARLSKVQRVKRSLASGVRYSRGH